MLLKGSLFRVSQNDLNGKDITGFSNKIYPVRIKRKIKIPLVNIAKDGFQSCKSSFSDSWSNLALENWPSIAIQVKLSKIVFWFPKSRLSGYLGTDGVSISALFTSPDGFMEMICQ